MNEQILNRMQQIGCELSELLIAQEEISKKADLMKEELIRYAEENGVTEKLDLGRVMLIPTMRQKQSLISHLVTPDWLYRFRTAGGRYDFKPKIEKADGCRYDELLKEVGYEVEFTPGWSIKRK